MMAARAAILPAGVSTLTSRLLQTIRLAGVDSATGSLLAELGDQGAQTLAAGDRGIAVLRARLVDRRQILQVLAGEARAEHEFGGARPVAEILRQDRRAGRIELAARGLVDGAVGAHQRRQKLLGLAGARIAAADAHLLAGRRRRDIEPGTARQPDHRVGVGIVHPARATIERHVEGGAVGDAAAADLRRRLHHDDLAVGRHDAPRCGDSGRTGADHDNVSLARQRRGSLRRRTGIAAKAADADRKLRRVIVMSWFPRTCGEREQLANLAASDVAQQPSW